MSEIDTLKKEAEELKDLAEKLTKFCDRVVDEKHDPSHEELEDFYDRLRQYTKVLGKSLLVVEVKRLLKAAGEARANQD